MKDLNSIRKKNKTMPLRMFLQAKLQAGRLRHFQHQYLCPILQRSSKVAPMPGPGNDNGDSGKRKQENKKEDDEAPEKIASELLQFFAG
ncbi:MAG: hypothetical protein ABIQ40_20615 [Bacteroidia bacterium]